MSSSHKNNMRGLENFIKDIRNCSNKEAEEKRVNKEMAKIRKKFKEATNIEGYDKRKYVCKLLYMYMLGYDIDFGYMEAVNLMASNKFSEKGIGYLALSILLHENHEMLPLIVQTLQNDLQARNEFHQCLALTAVANIGGKEMSESLAPIVQKLLISKATKAPIKKKAALCLLRLYRKYNELLTADVWAERINTLLEESGDYGVLTGLLSLLLALAQDNPKGYIGTIKKAIWLLTKIAINKEDNAGNYEYYKMIAPWLQVKLLKYLSYYETPEDKSSRNRMNEILKKILSSVDEAKGSSVNHKNALNAVLFEAIDLVIHLDDDRDLIRQATTLLGRFISTKETSNIRYLALEALGHLATLDSETANLVKKYQDTVILALRDPDISIRKRALDLLYGMCDKHNAKGIVTELINYLTTADYAIREELVLKIAILAEKYAPNYSWYVDIILQLIALAGDFVSDDIWFRVIQIITNHEDIQEYAAKNSLQAVKQSTVHEIGVKVAGYVLGEFGHLIADQNGSSPRDQLDSLHSKFTTSGISLQTKALLLSSYAKFVNLYPELADYIKPIFKTYQTSIDAEIQQRACEYYKLSIGSESLLQTVWDVMPAFPEKDSNKIGTGILEAESEDSNNSRPSSASNSVPNSPTSNQRTPISSPPQQTQPPAPKTIDLLSEIFSTAPSVTTTSSSYPSNVMTESLPSSSNANVTNNQGGLLDGLSIGQVVSSTVTSSPPRNTSVETSSSEISEMLKKLLMGMEGVLYQDDKIQIGFKSEYSKEMGRIMLYYGNVTSTPITSFSANVVAPSSLTMNAQPSATSIEPRTQAQQMITMAATSTDINLSNLPVLHLSFLVNGRNENIQVKLPIALHRFTGGLQMQGPAFFQQWKQIGENPPLSEQSIVKSSKPIDMQWLIKVVSTGFRLAVLQGVDPNINNLVASGNVFVPGESPSPCLVRIETNPQSAMYRVTVKSTDPQIASTFKDLFALELS